jgi:hypothetical protein
LNTEISLADRKTALNEKLAALQNIAIDEIY